MVGMVTSVYFGAIWYLSSLTSRLLVGWLTVH